MKINSIGINAYQEMTGRAQASKKPVETIKSEQVQKPGKVQIPSRADRVGSDLSLARVCSRQESLPVVA